VVLLIVGDDGSVARGEATFGTRKIDRRWRLQRGMSGIISPVEGSLLGGAWYRAGTEKGRVDRVFHDTLNRTVMVYQMWSLTVGLEWRLR